MRESRDIVRGWSELRSREEPVVLATVVATSGSTYRRPGARLLLSAERWVAGGISGGCLERDVLSKSWWRTREGPLVVTYDSTSADDEETWTFGLGCNGRVDVLLERLSAGGETHPLEFIAECIGSRRRGVLATVFRAGGKAGRVGQRLLLDGRRVRTDLTGELGGLVLAEAEAALGAGGTHSRQFEVGGEPVAVLFEVVKPPRSLVIFGTGQDAVPVVRLGASLGFHVTVVSNSPAGVPGDLFREADVQITATPAAVGGKLSLEPDAAVVVMTHNLSHDAGYLRFALQSACPYVGVLGPRARTERLLETLGKEGFPVTEAHRRRLFSPIGLHLGAEQPEEIALSVLAEIQALFSRADAQSLRHRDGPIHPREEGLEQ
jgi:xanthine/CO dehydrogenase XdhC/CoxF family maturation factor